MSLFCLRKCCELKFVNSDVCDSSVYKENIPNYGAGVCVITPEGILVSQAHHLYWGLPKGIIENNESIMQCALRELEEETGLVISSRQLNKFVFSFRYKDMNRKVTIFFMISKNIIELQQNCAFSDSTGYGFIKPLCILELYYSGKIKINYFTRVLLKLLFGL